MLRLWMSLLLIISFCTSCRSCRFNYCVQGADEFVIDSYQIRQGKLAILEMQGEPLGELPPDAMCEYKDTVCEDDILSIVVYHPSRRDLMDAMNFINNSVGFRVVNGCIDIPDIPSVNVLGLTLEQTKDTLQEEFSSHIKDIELFVSYKDRLIRKIDFTGLGVIPNLPVDGKMRLYEALSKARVPGNANLFKSYVVRDGVQLPIDMHQLMNLGDMSQNIVMKGGDKIYIADPAESNVMVMGEVLSPRPVPVPSGSISLREALVSAGGIPFTGNRNCIQVIRGSLVRPKIYVLSWEHIIHLPNESLLLIPGDTVFVAEKPITEWNRFISQLFPTYQGFQMSRDLYLLLP